MGINASDEYFLKKKALLKECLHFSEELIGSIESWESVPDIIAGKEAAVLQLSELEEAADAQTKALLSNEMKQELDQMIKLILDLDNDTANLIRKEQQNIIGSLKTNINEQKFIQYAPAPELARGRKLDYKK